MKFCIITFVIAFVAMALSVASPVGVLDKLTFLAPLQLLEWNADTTKAVAQTDTTITDCPLIGSRLSSQEVQQLLNLHNKVRADVGVGPVTWSKELAVYAQRWANHLASTNCSLQHRPPSGPWKREYGENLFMGAAGTFGVADVVKSWESEKQYYRGQTLDRSNSYDSGHYTQMVWRESQQIGCAKAECNGNLIIVCNYDPPGNVLGQKPY
jgi:pathogenesis-related protein 1